jgi:hypothetical protein
MTNEDIIELASQAGGIHYTEKDDNGTGMYATFEMVKFGIPMLERFAALVEEAVRNRVHTCHADCQNPICVAVREAVAAEREACLEDVRTVGGAFAVECEKLIRARGQG